MTKDDSESKSALSTGYVTVPKELFEQLIELAQENIANNEWRRKTTKRNNADMRDMDRIISIALGYMGS